MKALLLKDFYVLWKQMRLFMLILVVMSLVGGAFNSVFVVVWCSMLPYTAIAYDERSHWNQLAAMMPYSKRDLVLSKYMLGWLCMAVATVMSLVFQTAAVCIGGEGPDAVVILASVFTGFIALAATMPAIFRFGVERGRMIFLIIVFAVAIGAGAVADVVEELGQGVLSLPVMALLPLAAVATGISIPLSMKLYRVD